MIRFTKILIALGFVALLGCGTPIDSRTGSLQSCYDTGFGLKCLSTPDGLETAAIDVDGDGTADPFVCGDKASASDSDGTSADSDEASGEGDEASVEDGDADSASDSDDNSDSDEKCGPSIEDDTQDDSDSVSDLDGDGDGDGVSDGTDCDCM